MKLGLVIGRFQPLHYGHTSLLEKALEENDKVLVLVGSAGKLPDYKNPFPVETRIKLIEDHFEEDLGNLCVKGIKDYPSDSQWIEDVTARVMTMEDDPTNVTLYTSEKDETFYRTNFLYSVVSKSSEGISATDLRTAIYLGKPWVLVPEVTRVLMENYIGTDEWKRMLNEYFLCKQSKAEALSNHKFSNPIEPVVHAAVIQDNKVLLVKRGGVRGHGQWALPGGFLNHDETTRAGALRELAEETNVDLLSLERATELNQCIEENMKGLSTRTLGINYLYAVHKDEVLDIKAGDDAQEVQWVSLEEIMNDEFSLFYNHTTILRRLLAGVK
jgi:bifunctional NMN adenylyltransferase/nudix hydrolase